MKFIELKKSRSQENRNIAIEVTLHRTVVDKISSAQQMRCRHLIRYLLVFETCVTDRLGPR